LEKKQPLPQEGLFQGTPKTPNVTTKKAKIRRDFKGLVGVKAGTEGDIETLGERRHKKEPRVWAVATKGSMISGKSGLEKGKGFEKKGKKTDICTKQKKTEKKEGRDFPEK